MTNENIREAIRKIWRPILDTTTHAQEMAYLITQCVDETEALFKTTQTKAYDELLERISEKYEDYLTAPGSTEEEIKAYNKALDNVTSIINQMKERVK